ncbi:hypothetical protein B0T18DRAFT_30964 [Schizothecium vesticola]|uniref:Uncharacterized protein n=1 Tax=Schizothecium vesticola TaxID=314040 RepID=A0AA40FBA1_9PEZI|nr:hypothetical protein B0T18DRAFT_30964 [Schizothecium vesticola]
MFRHGFVQRGSPFRRCREGGRRWESSTRPGSDVIGLPARAPRTCTNNWEARPGCSSCCTPFWAVEQCPCSESCGFRKLYQVRRGGGMRFGLDVVLGRVQRGGARRGYKFKGQGFASSQDSHQESHSYDQGLSLGLSRTPRKQLTTSLNAAARMGWDYGEDGGADRVCLTSIF